MSTLTHSSRVDAARRHSRVAVIVGSALTVIAAAGVPFRESLFLAVAGAAEGSALAPAVSLVAKAGLLVLVAMTASIAAWSIRGDRGAFRTLLVAGVGVVAAYTLSEGIKLLVTEERPCRGLDVATLLACPESGDWSWPSNHATLAAAFATACALALPRSLWLGAPAALLVASSRVGAGVHYVHDVVSGLALGTLTVAVAILAASTVLDRRAGAVTAGGSTPGDGSTSSRHGAP